MKYSLKCCCCFELDPEESEYEDVRRNVLPKVMSIIKFMEHFYASELQKKTEDLESQKGNQAQSKNIEMQNDLKEPQITNFESESNIKESFLKEN